VWRTPPWVIVLRDMVCLAIGVWGVIHEELSGKADLGRLGFFAVLMVAPGVLAGVWLAIQQSGTAGPGPSSGSPPSPSPSPSPSGQ
jgi:hypothetical protein